MEMGGEVEAGIGAGDGVGLEVDLLYWDGLEIWREIGLGLGMKVRMGMGWRYSLTWFLREGSQCHACEKADDDIGEVQHGHVGTGEEDYVYENDAEDEAGNGGDEEEGPGRVQQVWRRKRIRNTKMGPQAPSTGERVSGESGSILKPSPLNILHPPFKKIETGL